MTWHLGAGTMSLYLAITMRIARAISRRMLPVEMIGVAMMAGQIPRSPSVFPP